MIKAALPAKVRVQVVAFNALMLRL